MADRGAWIALAHRLEGLKGGSTDNSGDGRRDDRNLQTNQELLCPDASFCGRSVVEIADIRLR